MSILNFKVTKLIFFSCVIINLVLIVLLFITTIIDTSLIIGVRFLCLLMCLQGHLFRKLLIVPCDVSILFQGH